MSVLIFELHLKRLGLKKVFDVINKRLENETYANTIKKKDLAKIPS